MSITWTSTSASTAAAANTATATVSTRLRTKLLLLEPEFRGATTHMWRAEGLVDRYRNYLSTMHAVIRASVPLMELALWRASDDPGDPLSEPLSAYLVEHIREEAGHDAWLLEDLVAAGATAGDAPGPLPPPDVATLVGPQFYWIENHHPVTLLGYIAVLEGYAPVPGLTDRIASLTGLPAAALRTVREHAALDTDHLDELYALLDRLPLTRDQEAAVAVSALHSLDALTRLFVRLGRSAPAPSLRGAGPTSPTGVTP
ncbi:iron-containing redox enzyme family protein [Streptomyces sp. NPDC018055]|uniref:iron-containing redox enzyme family protein n=1 Tax=Streptomyces sp. NPDC018055 TaxID=3365038 RepID=UPI0037ACD6D6